MDEQQRERRERRSRTDLKELARLATEMPRAEASTPVPEQPKERPSDRPPAWTRFSLPAIALPVPSPVITTMPEPIAAPAPALEMPIAPPRAPTSALTGAIVGACVGLVLSAIGIAALVLAR